MYINTQILNSKELSFTQLILLQLCKQQKFEDHSEVIEKGFYPEDINFLLSCGLIEEIKGSKKQTNFEKLRCSSKGSDLLDDVYTMSVSSGDLQMRDYLIQMYLSHEDKERVVGNKKKIASYIAIMRSHLSLTLHEFFYLCELFLSEHSFTKNLEYIFFNSNKNRYGKFENNIEDSPLFQFYDSRKKEVENYWQKKIKL